MNPLPTPQSPSLPTGTAEALFERFRRDGDMDALGELYDLLAPGLFRLGLTVSPDAAAAEDLLQGTFLVAIEEAAKFEAGRPVRPWLAGILQRRAQARRRRSAARREVVSNEGTETARPSSGEAEERARLGELREALNERLDELPAEWRPALVLRIEHGLTATQIAHALDRPPGTVRSQLARGTDRLRRALPAGLASAVGGLLGEPAQGLDIVRTQVLAEAARSTAAVAVTAPLTPLVTLATMTLLPKLFVAATILAGAVTLVLVGTSRERGLSSGASVTPDPEPVTLAAPERMPGPSGDAPRVTASEREVPTPVTAPTAEVPVEGGARVVVHVTDDGGAPVEGEIVLVSNIGSMGTLAEEFAQTTDALGQAAFDGLQPMHCTIQLLRTGSNRGLALAEGQERVVRLTIPRGITVRGQVVDVAGTPVAGAEVLVSQRWREDTVHALGLSDSRGDFVLRDLTEDHWISVRAEHHAATAMQRGTGEVGDEVELLFVLEREGASLSGQVVDEAGKAVAGALVQVGPLEVTYSEPNSIGYRTPSAPAARLRTNDQGFFHAVSVPPGQVTVAARARGYAPWLGETATGTPTRIVLHPAAAVEGRVTDDRARPVAGARVSWPGGGSFLLRSTVTAGDGRYRLGDLASGTVALRVQGDEGRAEGEVWLEAGSTTPWSPVLETTPRIHGTLVDPEGQDLAGWHVVARRGGPEGERSSAAVLSDGHFSLGPLDRGGTYTVWAHGPGGWRTFPRLVVTDLKPGPDPIELVVGSWRESTAELRLRSLGPLGDPVPGTKLTLWHEELRLWRDFSVDGKDGDFLVDAIPPGHVNAELRSPDHPWLDLGRFPVAAGEVLDLGEFLFEPAARVSGALLRLKPEDRDALVLQVIDSAGKFTGVIHQDGLRYHTSALPEGEYVLQARATGYVSLRKTFQLRKEEALTLDLEFEPASVRVLALEAPPGPPPSWVWCALYMESGTQPVWQGNFGGQGEFPTKITASARPGHYRFQVHTQGGWNARGELEVPPHGVTLEPCPVQLAPPPEEDS